MGAAVLSEGSHLKVENFRVCCPNRKAANPGIPDRGVTLVSSVLFGQQIL